MTWSDLTSLEQLEALDTASHTRPQLIFKHSTRCGTSAFVLERMNRGLAQFDGRADVHLLDLLAHRPVSNAIAERYAVHHESPQVLLIVAGECTYAPSHIEIDPQMIAAELPVVA